MKKHRDMEGEGERRWTPTRAKVQDTWASPNSLEPGTHLVRKWGDIGHLRVLSPRSLSWMDGLHFYTNCQISMSSAWWPTWYQ